MKRVVTLLISILIVALAVTGCSKSGGDKGETTKKAQAAAQTSNKMETVLNTAEYTLYQNIFYNDTKGDYDKKETTKEGIFTTLTDAYNDTMRYYVWGYNDQTKCCDWQWELKVDDASNLPTAGSLVKVEGTYEVNEAALDGLWIINPKITVEKEFGGYDYDIDMKTKSNTLERVQVINIVNKKEAFEGKTVGGYGRVLDDKTLQDAYYDNSWTIPISGDYELPAFGTLVEVEGKISNGEITECKISDNTQY